eukprot:1159976-Pelagomonas_calceolata.AAC.5
MAPENSHYPPTILTNWTHTLKQCLRTPLAPDADKTALEQLQRAAAAAAAAAAPETCNTCVPVANEDVQGHSRNQPLGLQAWESITWAQPKPMEDEAKPQMMLLATTYAT